MSRPQMVVLAGGVLALLGLILFPPWVAVSYWADGHADSDECERHFLLNPPRAPLVLPELTARIEAKRRAGAALYKGPDSYVVDWTRQIVPIAIAAAGTLSGLGVLRRPR